MKKSNEKGKINMKKMIAFLLAAVPGCLRRWG